jgi:hypothetical protein
LLATVSTILMLLLTLYFVARGEIELDFGKPCDTSDCRIIVAGRTFNLTLDVIDQFIRDWNHLRQNETGPERAFATYRMVLDRAPSLLLNAPTHYASLRQEVATWVRPLEKEARYQKASQAAYAHLSVTLRVVYKLLIGIQRSLIEAHLKHLDENVDKFTNGTFLTFPADIETCSPELKEAYTALRRTLFELYKHYTRIFCEAENRMKTKKWRGKTEKQKVEGMILYTGKATKESMVKPLEEATTCKSVLEMWVDIMKSYTELELDSELAEEWVRMLDDTVAPMYVVLRRFEAIVRIAQLEEPL